MRRAAVALVVTVVAVVLLAGYDTRPPAAQSLDTPRERRAAVRERARPREVEQRRERGRRTVSATGPAVTTPFSVIQVRATLTGRRLTGVETVALSGDGAHTEALNAKAEPILRRDALRAHSARIDTVSGATYSSEAWIDSLESAIDAARRELRAQRRRAGAGS